MVRKLIKHEAIRTSGLLGTVFGAAALLTVLGALLTATRWPLIAQFGLGAALVGAVGVLPAAQLALGIDYWRHSYRRAGYLTQTLPVRGATIYWAKLVWAGVVMVAALLWAVLLGGVTFMGAAPGLGHRPTDVFGIVADQVAAAARVVPWWGWAPGVLLVLALLILPVVEYFFAASLGSERALVALGLGGPVLVWFLLYFAMQVLLMAGMVALPFGVAVGAGGVELVTQDFWHLMVTDTPPTAMPIGFLPVLVVAFVVLVWRTTISWDRKVTLA